MKFFVVLIMISGFAATLPKANASENLSLLSISSVNPGQPEYGKIVVSVVSQVPCGMEYLGVLTRSIPPMSLSSPYIEVRSIARDTGKKCMAADRFVTDTFELYANIGPYHFFKVQP